MKYGFYLSPCGNEIAELLNCYCCIQFSNGLFTTYFHAEYLDGWIYLGE